MIDKNDSRNIEDERMLEEVIKLCVHAPKTALETEGADVVKELGNFIYRCFSDINKLLDFFDATIPVACYGLKTVPKEKKDSIKAMFLPVFGEETSELFAYGDRFYEPLTDEGYNFLIKAILPLNGSEPFTADPYSPDITSAYSYYVYRFILYCAILGGKNEEGINKLREVRRDFVSYVLSGETD